jgi:hypothetical protein
MLVFPQPMRGQYVMFLLSRMWGGKGRYRKDRRLLQIGQLQSVVCESVSHLAKVQLKNLLSYPNLSIQLRL